MRQADAEAFQRARVVRFQQQAGAFSGKHGLGSFCAEPQAGQVALGMQHGNHRHAGKPEGEQVSQAKTVVDGADQQPGQ